MDNTYTLFIRYEWFNNQHAILKSMSGIYNTNTRDN